MASADTVIVTLTCPIGGATAPIWPVGIHLAPLLVREAPAIHAVLVRAYANGYGTVQPDWLDWFEWMTTDPEFDQKLCFVARAAAGDIVGFCLVWSSAFVKDLVVEPAWHRRGIGTALLATAIDEMRRRGHTSLRLKVDARNLAAKRLYARVGFVEEGTE